MKNPFQFRGRIRDMGEEHFSRKKKPWEDRVEYPPKVAILYLIQVVVLGLLILFKSDWLVFVLLFAACSAWGLAEATKLKYYKIGYYEGTQHGYTDFLQEIADISDNDESDL